MAIYLLRVKLTYGPGSKVGVNTWHIRRDTPPVPGAQPLITALGAFYQSVASEVFCTDQQASFDGNVVEVGTDTPTQIGGLTTFTATGLNPATAYGSAGVGMCISWKSSLANRQGRGRTFLSPLASVAFQGDGTLSDTKLGNIRTAATTLVNASKADGNGGICVWSTATPKGGVAPAPGHGVARDIIGHSISDKVAWLSSRRG
jgi:hypothetical protein